ncbi:hypothetical protein J32TS6_15010 [Virgibacillus pantothenticus]|nr:hypothetical protein J32TS6_15010 [Virgibacillus pantothenticus]
MKVNIIKPNTAVTDQLFITVIHTSINNNQLLFLNFLKLIRSYKNAKQSPGNNNFIALLVFPKIY